MKGAWGEELIIKTSMRALAPLLSWSSGNDSGKQIQRLAVQILVRTRQKVTPVVN